MTTHVVELQDPVDDEERDDADRDVDQEDPAPAVDAQQVVLACESAADDRASTLEVPKTARK